MTNEEKILERLDALTEEVRQAKQAIRPYVELKQEMEPLVNNMIINSIHKLGGLDKRFSLEDIADLIGELLVSSKSLTEALRGLNRFMELKEDFGPYSKEIFKELVTQLETTLHGFDAQNLQHLLQQFIVNMGNLAEGLKLLGSAMEMRKDAGELSKLAFNDAVGKLENLQQRGVFDSFEHVLDVTERLGKKMKEADFDNAPPVKGIFGMVSAMKRPEVQEGLGVLIELSTVMTALKEKQSVG